MDRDWIDPEMTKVSEELTALCIHQVAGINLPHLYVPHESSMVRDLNNCLFLQQEMVLISFPCLNSFR